MLQVGGLFKSNFLQKKCVQIYYDVNQSSPIVYRGKHIVDKM